MKEGKQFFKLDGPIGRKQYVMVVLFLSVYGFIASIILTLLHTFIEVNKYNLILFIILWAVAIIPICYATWINYSKRIWDLIGDKNNAIFYTTAFYIGCFAVSFIPIVKYFGIVFSLIVAGILLLKRGKLVLGNCKNKENEE